MKIYVKSLVVLTAICGIIAVLLAAANGITAPIISENASAAANEALLVVMPDGGNFEKVELTSYELPESVQEVFKASNGGYVLKLSVTGFGSDMIIMCGVDTAGTVTGATCLSSNETNGVEKTYGEKVKGATIDTVGDLDTVGGSTMTSNGYKGAIKDALNAATIVGGGSADLRTEEEILNDNLNTVLPAAEGKFESIPLVQDLEDISAVYVAENASGAVVVCGEQFIALSMEGKVLSAEIDAALAAKVEEQAKDVISLKKIDLSQYENLPTQLKRAYEAANGNYLFELAANGFGMQGDRTMYIEPNNVPIMLVAEVTAEGKIVACKTLSHQESPNYGAACGKEAFYSQFNGKDESNYKEIDGIGGATVTTRGYLTAVGKVFEIVKILKGEA